MDIDYFKHWVSAIHDSNSRPAYLMIADLIASDLESGVLRPRDKLPTLRELASLLGLNYTTVARAYNEARGRGLIDSHPGTGTFVRGRTSSLTPKGGSDIEMTMNLPPEPQNVDLLRKIKRGFQRLGNEPDIYTMFRYQDFGGSQRDKEAGLELLSPFIDQPDIEKILVCPGIHSILLGLLSQLARPGTIICVQSLVYPGLKAIAAQLNISLHAMSSDNDGPLIRPLEELCKKGNIAALYLNPTLNNPTTRTISRARRESLAELALRYSIPIIEDDAYGLLPETPISPIAKLAPEVSYYINGLSKCFGAGTRTAYLHAPSKQLATRMSGAMRSLAVMASPITNALATEWIMDGSFNAMTNEIRQESIKRQALAQQYLSGFKFEANQQGFHLWLQLPKRIEMSSSQVAENLRARGISAVSSAAFCTDNNPAHAIRVCLGGYANREQCEDSLALLANLLTTYED